MSPRSLLLTSAVLLAWAAVPGRAAPPQVRYVAPDAGCRQGLFERWCRVMPARLGGPAYAAGDREAPDLASLPPAELAAASVLFLDAAAAGGMGETHAAALARYVRAGGKLIVEGCDGYLDSLAALLPVERAEPRACGVDPPSAPEPGHPALLGVPVAAWRVEGFEVRSRAKADARVLLAAGGVPLLAAGKAGEGKVVATPLTHLPGCYAWAKTPGYDSLLTLLALVSAEAPDETLLAESWASTCRYFMYAGFAAGYHKYRFDASGPAISAYDEAETKLLAARASLERRDWPQYREALQGALAASAKAASASGNLGGALTTAEAEAASARADLFRLPGTLDVVPGMNLSEGRLDVPGFWYPRSGRELLDERPRLDLPPGACASFWRGLHPYVLASGDLPSEPDAERLWQRRSDGSRVEGAGRETWINPAAKALLAQTFSYAHDGAVINETGAAEWNTYGTSPDADFSDFAQRAFRLYLAERGLSPGDVGAKSWDDVAPPRAWVPGRLYYEWQAFRSLYECERLKTSFWGLKLVAPKALAMLQPGDLNDPWRGGVSPEAAAHVDLLCPLLMRGAGASADPLDVEVACRELLSLVDDDGDGAPERTPGFAARFDWGDPLALPPAAHRSAASVALLLGARGIMEGFARDGKGGDAAAAMPEEVFLRWQAAFEPSLRYEDLFLGSRPAEAAVAVWNSWHSAAMAQGGGEASGADTWALSQAREWSALIYRAGLTSRLLYDRHVQAGNFLGAACVVVPSTLCISDAEQAKLTAFAEQGGALILGCGSGAYDAYHQPRAKGLGALGAVDPGQVVVGKERVKAQVASRWVKPIGAPALALGPVTQPLRVAGDAEVLATLAGGPVACLRRLGRGAVIYVGASVWAGDGPSQMLILKALESLGVRRQAYAQDASGGWAWQARVLVMRRGAGALVGVVNCRPYSQQQPLPKLSVRVRMPAGSYVVSRLSEARPFVRNDRRSERVESSFADGGVAFRASLEPYDVQLFLLDRR